MFTLHTRRGLLPPLVTQHAHCRAAPASQLFCKQKVIAPLPASLSSHTRAPETSPSLLHCCRCNCCNCCNCCNHQLVELRLHILGGDTTPQRTLRRAGRVRLLMVLLILPLLQSLELEWQRLSGQDDWPLCSSPPRSLSALA